VNDSSRFAPVRRLLDAQVADGRLPGYVAAVRAAGTTELLCGGTLAVGGSEPMRPDTLFRLASVTKIVGGVLALALVEDGVLTLDDEIGGWLPELAEPRVTARRGGPLDETVPAVRSITVRHLLTNTAGLGWAPGLGPLTDAMDARGVGPGAFGPDLGADEFLGRLGELPLSAQPGDTWAYHTCSDVLSVLLARATGRTVGALVTDLVAGPLGLRDTSFWTAETDRLASCYLPTDAGLELCEPPDGRFARPRSFETLSAGLLSTAPDVMAVLTAVLDGGGRVLTRESAVALTTDALTPAQLAVAADVVGPGRSYGVQVGVDVEDRADPFRRTGRWGWDGGTGTSAWADPDRQLAGVLLTQRMMTGPPDEPNAFWATLTACA
jgi:CubicO group peptidase (beta-lactamase class C family)